MRPAGQCQTIFPTSQEPGAVWCSHQGLSLPDQGNLERLLYQTLLLTGPYHLPSLFCDPEYTLKSLWWRFQRVGRMVPTELEDNIAGESSVFQTTAE